MFRWTDFYFVPWAGLLLSVVGIVPCFTRQNEKDEDRNHSTGLSVGFTTESFPCDESVRRPSSARILGKKMLSLYDT